MARNKSKDKSFKMALKYRDLLLYEITSGNMGTKPEIPIKNKNATFAEKKGLLAEMIKLAMIEQKNMEGDDVPSGLDIIRSQLNGDRTARSERDTWGAAEGSPDDSDAASTFGSES